MKCNCGDQKRQKNGANLGVKMAMQEEAKILQDANSG